MIPKEIVDTVFATLRIEEVVGDFVNLKKRGTNYIGLCPFHNEKTPSFNVSPVKGIYKCFGCGKGGNGVDFIMEHEHCSFPEAVKYVAGKYNIEIPEVQASPEEDAARNERESLFVVNTYAQRFYSDYLYNTDEGKAIGLSYFHERGFKDETIKEFQLGFSPDKWDGLTVAALGAGYSMEFLEKTGLTINNETKTYDRYRGRVMFPIHNLTGRVVGFGGRILKADPKSPKYVNSPESEIYHKSKILYGMFQSRKEISVKENCFLVEGYTDVISLHQSGIKNVVASSGTSLTVDQIRLIKRYTSNITVLFDGDAAGIKASIRGIDLILEEGMNVKVVLFPDGEDPDSFSKRVSDSELKTYLSEQAKDFVLFRTNLMLEEVKGDPVKKAGLIKDVIASIAKVPDPILVATYVRECAVLMEMGEDILFAELRKQQIAKNKAAPRPVREQDEDPGPEPPDEAYSQEASIEKKGLETENLEKDVLRLIINYGEINIHLDSKSESGEVTYYDMRLVDHLIGEILADELVLNDPLFADLFEEIVFQVKENGSWDPNYFLNHPDSRKKELCIDLSSEKYIPSENWKDMHDIHVPSEVEVLKHAAHNVIYKLKLKSVLKMIEVQQQILKNGEDEQAIMEALQMLYELQILKSSLSSRLGIVILPQ